METPMIDWDVVTASMVTVGKGRGFVVQAKEERAIITAAHCLPRWPVVPPCWPTAYINRTYEELVGPLEQAPEVSAECMFVDPVADLAVLFSPDPVWYRDEAQVFDELVNANTPLAIGETSKGATLYMPDLELDWYECITKYWEHELSIGCPESLAGGMLGSPIINDAGLAVAVLAGIFPPEQQPQDMCVRNPVLTERLPGFLLKQFSG